MRMVNIETILSDDYLTRNILALTTHKNDFNIKNTKMEDIIEKWDQCPSINIIEEINKHDMKLIYPVMIIYQSDNNDFDSDIKNIPEYITECFINEGFDLSIEYSIFFILLPLKEVKTIKKEVIEWIGSKKPLMS